LNIDKRRRLSWRTGQYDRRAGLVRPLNQPDRELWTQSHDCSAPSLACGRITETVRLKVIPGIDEEALRSLVIDI